MKDWNKFLKTGKVSDYLKYKEEISKENSINDSKKNKKGSNNTKKY